ncbi:UbiA prenyltransferase family, partial [Trametes punicea]
PGTVLQRFIWVWLHALQFCVSNQCVDPAEDRKNQPWRPIPSGKISLSAASRLRWALLVACLALSASWGAFGPSTALSLATLAYNELRMSSWWFTRNALNAVGYVSFCVGAARAGSSNFGTGLRGIETLLSIHVVHALIIMTTIQAQDFKDVEGDTSVGRHTLPILYPVGSRVATAVIIPMWSVLVIHLWTISTALAAAIVGVGLLAGLGFFCCRSTDSDRRSYMLYNVWLCLLHVAPFVRRGKIIR